MEQTTPKPLDEAIKTEIAKFNVAEAEINSLQEQFKTLTINGLDDKLGYKAVDDFRKICKNRRVEIEKKGKALRDYNTQVNKAILAEEARLINPFSEMEIKAAAMQKTIDDEKERIKREAAEAEQIRIRTRTGLLFENGMTFDGNVYKIGDLSITDEQIKTLSDEDFSEFKTKVVFEYELELDREAEKQALIKEGQKAQETKQNLFQAKLVQLQTIGFKINHGDSVAGCMQIDAAITFEALRAMDDQEFLDTVTKWKIAIDAKVQEAEDKKKAEEQDKIDKAAAAQLKKQQEEQDENLHAATDKEKMTYLAQEFEKLLAIQFKSKRANTLIAETKTAIGAKVQSMKNFK